MIVRDKVLIKKIQKDLSSIALTFYLYLYTDEERVRDRLKKEGFSKDVIERRIERNRTGWWNDYLATPDDEIIVIINSSNKTDFHKKINLLVDKYSNRKESNEILYLTPTDKITLPQPLVGFKRQMVETLAKYPYEKNIFLMMKYRDENKEYYTRITLSLKNAGYNCVRADSPEWNLTRETHNYIAVALCCKYGIALFDEPEIKMIKGKRCQVDYNPNVAYEIGMMQAYNKNCLILQHESLSDTPFDLVKDLLVKYKGLDLLSKVENWLESIKNIKQ